MSRSITEDELEQLRTFIDNKLENLNDFNEIIKLKRRNLIHVKDRLFLEIEVNSGYRLSEILSLKWNQVYDFEKNRFFEKFNIGKDNMKGKKKGRKHIISLTVKHWLKLLKHIWHRLYGVSFTDSKESHIFRSFKKIDYNIHKVSAVSIFYRFLQIFKELDIDYSNLSTHSFRKLYIQRMYELCDRDIVKTAIFSGHSNPQTLLFYLNAEDKKIDKVLKEQ